MFFRQDKQTITPPKQEEAIPLPQDSDGLVEFIETIKKITGIDLAPKKEVIKERLGHFAQSEGIKTFKSLSEKILENSTIRQKVIDLVSINETYFFRELPQLQNAIEFLKTLSGHIRILSAPCSSGEEVYSIGMLIHKARLDFSKIKIFGIDISSEAIDKSLKGVYSTRSLHRLDEDLKTTFFEPSIEGYKIKKHILPECEFKKINIFEDKLLDIGYFDLIFSRNMMIYFNEKYRLKAIERFCKILKAKGRLYVGHADLVPQTPLFEKIITGTSSYYQKYPQI